jgi:integrase
VERARDPFLVATLHQWVEGREASEPEGGAWLRDAVLVAFGLRTMSRANELAALTSGDVQDKGHLLVICVRRVKTDPVGRGSNVFVEASGSCPVRLFRRFMEWHGARGGLLFTTRSGTKMSAGAITSVCRRMVAAVGGNEKVSSHSLRIGGATAAVEGGLTKEQIMMRLAQ